MKIELKKVDYSARLSEETFCFAAQVWIDGKHAFDASNRGHGGPTDFNDRPGFSYEKIDAQIKATYPKQSFKAGGETHEYETDLEAVVNDLLSDWLLARDLRRDLGKKILWIKGAECWQVPKRKGHEAEQLKALKAKHSGITTLNELAFDEALKIYKAAVEAAKEAAQ